MYLWLSPDIKDKGSLNNYYSQYFNLETENGINTAKLKGDIAVPDEIHVPLTIDNKMVHRVDFSEYTKKEEKDRNLKILVDYVTSSCEAQNGLSQLSSLEIYRGSVGNEKHIGEAAFTELKNLREVYLNVYSEIDIEYSAFKNCTSLQKLEISGSGGSIKDIKESAFENCISLQSIVVPKEETPEGGIQEMEMPEGADFGTMFPGGQGGALTISITGNIGTYAFKGLNAITNLTIESCNSIEPQAFEGCSNLKQININNTKSIYRDAFLDCIVDQEEQIQNIKVQFTNVESVGDISFNEYQKQLNNGEENIEGILWSIFGDYNNGMVFDWTDRKGNFNQREMF